MEISSLVRNRQNRRAELAETDSVLGEAGYFLWGTAPPWFRIKAGSPHFCGPSRCHSFTRKSVLFQLCLALSRDSGIGDRTASGGARRLPFVSGVILKIGR